MTSVRPESALPNSTLAPDLPPAYFYANKYTVPNSGSSRDQSNPSPSLVYPVNYPPIYNPTFYSISGDSSSPNYGLAGPPIKNDVTYSTRPAAARSETIKPCIPCLNTKLKRAACVILTCLAVLILIVGVVYLIILATVPCVFQKCNSRASVCKNYPFRAQCVCDYGFGGDGVNYCDECGLVSAQSNLRIVGGVTATPSSWPASVLINFNYKARVLVSLTNEYIIVSQQSTCGGTLIDRKTVLTAAHCIQSEIQFTYNGNEYTVQVAPNTYYPTMESMFTIYLGVYNKTAKGTYPSQPKTAKKVVRNSNYDSVANLNDIALILLNEEATLNQYVQIACLPNQAISFYPNDTNIASWIVGWGDLFGNRTYPDLLQNAKITLFDSSGCNRVFPSVTKNWSSQICAGKLAGGVDSCQGDSGGSLYVLDTVNNKSKYVSSGIVSYGNGCALPNYPGIYTRVSYFMDWIIYQKWL